MVSQEARLTLGGDLTVVEVIQTGVGVIRVIDDECTTQAITILGPEMAVVPVCALRNQRN
jgi:hypothetical protein